MLHPEPLRDATWNYIVLGAAAVFEGGSFAGPRRAARPRAAIAKAAFPLGPIPQHPLAHALAVHPTAQRHGADRFAHHRRLNHPQPTYRRQWCILVGVHSVLLARTDGVATISFFQLDR